MNSFGKRAQGVRLRQMPEVDVVVVSHDHCDHLDCASAWARSIW